MFCLRSILFILGLVPPDRDHATRIEGYESLHTKTGSLQGAIGNLVLNDDEENLSLPAFLAGSDLAIQEKREQSSGARSKTETRAFMAIGLLLGEKHSFMHDLESFWGVLSWICIHYNGPTVVDNLCPGLKNGITWTWTNWPGSNFINMVSAHFTDYCKPSWYLGESTSKTHLPKWRKMEKVLSDGFERRKKTELQPMYDYYYIS